MSCDRARKLMVLADSLSKEEQVDLEEHLRQCSSCAEEWRKWQKLFLFLSHLPSISSTPYERIQLVQALNRVPKIPESDCATAQGLIWRWIDDDLSAQERASLFVHLANCDKCQRALWKAEQTVRVLRSLPHLKATAVEKEALKARLRQIGKRPTFVPFVWRIVFPVAAAAVLALVIFAKWQSSIHDRTPVVKTVQEKISAPSVAKTQLAATPQLPAPKVAKRTGQPMLKTRRPQVLAQIQKPSKSERTQIPTERQAQIAKTQVQLQVKQLSVPKPSETLPPVQTASEPSQKVTTPETAVAEALKVVSTPTVTVPIPSQPLSSATTIIVSAPSSQATTSQLVQDVPAMASLKSEPRQLVTLPPITSTSEGDLTLQPPRVQITVVPPSQRLYQKSGVALITVPPEKRPPKVSEERALVPDLSIPLAAERYRSHTAAIPLFRFGISW